MEYAEISATLVGYIGLTVIVVNPCMNPTTWSSRMDVTKSQNLKHVHSEDDRTCSINHVLKVQVHMVDVHT